MTDRIFCSAKRGSGYWKGYPCAALAEWKFKDKVYCNNHLPREAIIAEELVKQ